SRAVEDASRSDPTSCHDGSTPVSSRRRRYSAAPYIIIVVRVTELRSWPTRPAEGNVEPEVSSARSTRTMSVQPRSARWYATDVPPTPPPMITARASSDIGDKPIGSIAGRAAQWHGALPESVTWLAAGIHCQSYDWAWSVNLMTPGPTESRTPPSA